MAGEPSTWKVARVADIGTSELFVHRMAIEIPKLLDASTIREPYRAKTKGAIGRLKMDGFMPAFEHLRSIRANAVDQPVELKKEQVYADFMRTLWHGYRDLLPKAADEMGFDITFIFRKASEFEKGLTAFLNHHPAINEFVKLFPDYLRQQRATGQNDLARVRNDYLEHRKLEWEDVRHAYCVAKSEMFFERAWTTASDILVVLIVSKFPPRFGIAEIPVAERNPKWPDQFKFVLRQIKTPS
jgi:hypothetical protein